MANPDTTIQLRPEDLDFIFTQVSNPGLDTRNVSGFANNLTPGRAFWGTAEQPFLRLTPAQFEPQTETQTSPNAVRTTSVDGTTPLPNPRLVSDVIGQQALDANGNTISTPNPYGNNLFLMSFGQFFDHGLDFYARGGGPDLVPIADMNEQLAAAQLRLNEIRAAQGLAPVQLDQTDNLLAQLEHDPQPFEFLIGSRAGRFDAQADGSVAADADGIPVMNNATGTAHLNRTSPFVDQSQSYGSAPEITYLLRESARTAAGELIPDGHGGWVKTYRLLDGAAELGPDGVARGTLPSYADILVNNGVSRDAIDRLLADVAAASMTNFEAWIELKSLSGFVDFGEIGPTHLILLGDKNDDTAAPVGQDGAPNPDFSLADLLSYHIAGDHRPTRTSRSPRSTRSGTASTISRPSGSRRCTRNGATNRSSRPRKSSRRPSTSASCSPSSPRRCPAPSPARRTAFPATIRTSIPASRRSSPAPCIASATR